MNRKLKAKIIEKYGSQFKFAQVINEHESNVSRVVRNRRKLAPEAEKRWAKKLGCKPQDVFEGRRPNDGF